MVVKRTMCTWSQCVYSQGEKVAFLPAMVSSATNPTTLIVQLSTCAFPALAAFLTTTAALFPYITGISMLAACISGNRSGEPSTVQAIVKLSNNTLVCTRMQPAMRS